MLSSKTEKKPAFKYLSDSERSEIQILNDKGYGVREISRSLGRSPNTISQELQRVPSGYKAALAKQYARTKLKNRRLQWRKINKCKELREYIIAGLKDGWSPDVIAGRMKKERKPWYASKSNIYAWLETARGEPYKKYLYGERPGRRCKKSGKQGQLLNTTSINERPTVINDRERAGDWESDLIVSARGTPGGISTTSERLSRFLVAEKVPDLTAESKQKTLVSLTQEFLVQSITFDRGHENAKHHELTIPSYFCNAYHSWEKGGVENQNKGMRRYLPKKTDLSSVTEEYLQSIVMIINNTPRKILGYATAMERAVELGVIKSKLSTGCPNTG
jgi:transposase, IS30 family